MPGTQPTQGDDGAIPAAWNTLANAIAGNQSAAAAQATQTNGQILDQYQNTPVIIGLLNQTVTIGAGWITGAPVVGVEVGTGLTGNGIAYASAFAHSTIATTKGSTTATLVSGTGFVNGMQIGATLLETPPLPSATQPPNYIQPGTSMTISGTTVTLSIAALLTGTGLYACAVTWTKLNLDVHP